MSDVAQGPGWGQASDGKWYPPQSAPAVPTPAPPGGLPAMAPGAAPRNNDKALWSLVLGLLSIVACGFIAGIPAIILGGSAKREIRAAAGAQGGASMATAGIVLGWISVAITGLVFLFILAIVLLGESSSASFVSVGTSIGGG